MSLQEIRSHTILFFRLLQKFFSDGSLSTIIRCMHLKTQNEQKLLSHCQHLLRNKCANRRNTKKKSAATEKIANSEQNPIHGADDDTDKRTSKTNTHTHKQKCSLLFLTWSRAGKKQQNKYSSHLLYKLQTYKINLKDKNLLIDCKDASVPTIMQILTYNCSRLKKNAHFDITRFNQISVLWMRTTHHISQIWFWQIIRMYYVVNIFMKYFLWDGLYKGMLLRINFSFK